MHTLFSYDSYIMLDAHFPVDDIVSLFNCFSTRSTHLNKIHSSFQIPTFLDG
jgi:hypothetical protein